MNKLIEVAKMYTEGELSYADAKLQIAAWLTACDESEFNEVCDALIEIE